LEGLVVVNAIVALLGPPIVIIVYKLVKPVPGKRSIYVPPCKFLYSETGEDFSRRGNNLEISNPSRNLPVGLVGENPRTFITEPESCPTRFSLARNETFLGYDILSGPEKAFAHQASYINAFDLKVGYPWCPFITSCSGVGDHHQDEERPSSTLITIMTEVFANDMGAREACYLTLVGGKDTAIGWCIVSLVVAAAIIARIVVGIGEGLVCHGREA
jgi:hypothetical protein